MITLVKSLNVTLVTMLFVFLVSCSDVSTYTVEDGIVLDAPFRDSHVFTVWFLDDAGKA